MTEPTAHKRTIDDLLRIMAALRDPVTGCPWDLEQTSESILPYTIEEAQEVADAVLRRDMPDLADELGDLLLQVVFHARIAEENGAFAFGDVVEAISEKLIRRHPHVFGEQRALSPEAVKTLWSEIKAGEKAKRTAQRMLTGTTRDDSVLAGVLPTTAALTRALRLQEKAASVGFDWDNIAPVIDKLKEETAEIEDAILSKSAAALHEEIGDLLFAAVNLARHANGDPESILHRASEKFERRFRSVEQGFADRGRSTAGASLQEMELLWTQVKRAEPDGLTS